MLSIYYYLSLQDKFHAGKFIRIPAMNVYIYIYVHVFVASL